MTSRDLFREILDGQLSLTDGHDAFDLEIARINQGLADSEWWSTLGFSQREATAIAHGVPFEVLVGFRESTWPRSCRECGLAIDYEAGGWWIEEDTEPITVRHLSHP